MGWRRAVGVAARAKEEAVVQAKAAAEAVVAKAAAEGVVTGGQGALVVTAMAAEEVMAKAAAEAGLQAAMAVPATAVEKQLRPNRGNRWPVCKNLGCSWPH